MTLTKKFSEFSVAVQNNSDEEVVGLEAGVNVRSERFLNWTTAGRPATPFNGLLGLNTDTQTYEFWDAVAMMWTQMADTNVLAVLASHAAGQGASLIGLQDQSGVTSKTVQDLANASFIVQTNNGSLQNAQALGSLATGIVKNTTATGVLSISAPLTSIDGLTTAANEMLYTTGVDTYATTSITALGRSLVAGATAEAVRVILGLAPLTDGQLIIGATGTNPSLATLTQGSGVTITNSPGGIEISATGTGGTVTSLSAGTGITLTPDPITTTGSIALTVPVTAILGGTGLITYTLGDTLYSSAANTLAKLAGNITTAKQYLSQTGDGALSAAPVWATISGSDITGAALTKTDDTNVTLSLGGTPTTALLRAASLTLGWTGTLSGTRGGTGVNNGANTATFAGNLNFAEAFTTSGAFAVTQTYTGVTNVTFPTSGTLATTSQIPTGAALTKTDDTNVTLTLGGSPTTALINAASLTLGWTGQLSLTRGGSNASLTASNGGIVYSTATAMAILAGTATAGQIVRSGANAPPTWSTATYPATAGTSGNVMTSDGTNWNSTAPAASATSVIVDDTTTNATMYPTWVTASTGSLPLKVSSTKLFYNPSTATLSVVGNIAQVNQLVSSTGAILANFVYTASAVNYVGFGNNSTGNAPYVYAHGSDSTVQLALAPKGGMVNIHDFSAAAAGELRFMSASNTGYTGLTIATAQATQLTFTLPAAFPGSNNMPMTSTTAGVLSFSGTPFLSAATATSISFGGSVLNTYSEGTFTPVLVSSGGGTATYNIQVGSYTKIGNRVLFEANLNLTNHSLSAGNLTITGLPFSAGTYSSLAVTCGGMAATAITMIQAYVSSGTAIINLYKFSAGAQSTLTVANISTTAQIFISGQFYV